MYRITWTSQFLTLLLGNMGFILLGGKALKVRSSVCVCEYQNIYIWGGLDELIPEKKKKRMWLFTAGNQLRS